MYAVLDTRAGVERAFRRLDAIKDKVVWWETGAQPPQMLADGEVLMSTAYTGRIFNAQVLEEQSFVIVWDGQVLDTSLNRHRRRPRHIAWRSGAGSMCWPEQLGEPKRLTDADWEDFFKKAGEMAYARNG